MVHEILALTEVVLGFGFMVSAIFIAERRHLLAVIGYLLCGDGVNYYLINQLADKVEALESPAAPSQGGEA